MNNKEKLPKLVDVFDPKNPLIGRRQTPLVLSDDKIMLIMDIKNSGIMCDNHSLRGKELEEFACKWNLLSPEELKVALKINIIQVMKVLKQNIPCVGCRRSVERLYFQLHESRSPTLDPLFIQQSGSITIQEDKQSYQILGAIFQDHATRLAELIENQPKRNKKSVRCLLHSLDSQRCRPMTTVWRDVWDCMRLECKKHVCIIYASSLHTTLETYLRKHRFCAECRTKVLKAYSLLVDDSEATKEKGYVPSLYAGIKRSLSGKRIHLESKTDYITKLITRAEPELLGSRRERHAKTLEIAQEEVLTCLGICMYERLHRIYMRMREEECTCQILAAVAVDTLSRNFETAVERKRGISKLELLYAEFAREEQQKQMRKEQKKIKRKRRKGKLVPEETKENFNDCEDGKDKLDRDKDNEIGCYKCEILTKSASSKSLAICRHSRACSSDLDDCSKQSDEGDYGEGSAKLQCSSNLWLSSCIVKNKDRQYKCDNYLPDEKDNSGGSASDHSHDCGYSSETNRYCDTVSLTSSLSSSPESSELACSDSCCQHDIDYISNCRLSYCGSLQEMLEGYEEDGNSEYYITPEEVNAFKSKGREVDEKRQELRETLQKRFAEFCVNGPLQVPRLQIPAKYPSN